MRRRHHRACRALVPSVAVFVAALGIAAPAAADLPPPDGKKRVPYRVVVDGLDAAADRVLVVYPWSRSNGAPGAEVGAVEAGKPLAFGRRIRGTPELWAVERSAFAKWQAAGADPEAFVASTGATRCTGDAISPRHTVDEDGPAEIVDRYHVAALDAGGCKLTRAVAAAPEPASRGCATSPGDGGWLALLLALGALLGLRRRQ